MTKHAPELQDCPIGHATPQRPQLFVSVSGLTQAPLQLMSPSGHTTPTQVPARQDVPIAHTRPHAPQLFASAFVSTHAPPQLV